MTMMSSWYEQDTRHDVEISDCDQENENRLEVVSET
jgi:hypothetical protein